MSTTDKWAEKHQEKGRQIALALADAANAMGRDDDVAAGLHDQLRNVHRTLQQSAGRILLGLVKLVANDAGDPMWQDPRNEAWLALCRKLVDEHKYDLPLPLV